MGESIVKEETEKKEEAKEEEEERERVCYLFGFSSADTGLQ